VDRFLNNAWVFIMATPILAAKGACSSSDAPDCCGDCSRRIGKSPDHQVLIVDDEPLIRWWLAETLMDLGYAVTEADDASTALRMMADGHFETVLLDFRLPDSNDLTLLARLHDMAPEARFILMTAYGTPEVKSRALELGAYRVVDKPFTVEELTPLVDGTRPSAR
jgi:DNA-binding NtrC family response regulator